MADPQKTQRELSRIAWGCFLLQEGEVVRHRLPCCVAQTTSRCLMATLTASVRLLTSSLERMLPT